MVNNLRVLFFVLAAFISCTLFSFCNTQDDNAAPYYIKAYELIKYPKETAAQETIDDIIKNAYRSKNSQIEEILKNNEPAFKELEKGTSKPRCDFTPFVKSLQKGGMPNYMALRNLVRLSTVKGRYYVSLGKYDKASDSYLNVITLAKHLPQQDKHFIKKMFDVSFVAIVTPSIKALLQEKAVSKETLTKIDKQLHDYELHTVTLVELFQAYKGEMMNDEIDEIYGIKAQLNDSLKKHSQQISASDRKFLYDTTLTEAETLINRYMGYYIKAAQTNNPSDWDFADKEYRLLSESATLTPTSSFSYIIKSWLNSIIYKKAALKETAKMLAKMFVDIPMSSLSRVREQYHSVMNGIKEVRGLIAKRLH